MKTGYQPLFPWGQTTKGQAQIPCKVAPRNSVSTDLALRRIIPPFSLPYPFPKPHFILEGEGRVQETLCILPLGRQMTPGSCSQVEAFAHELILGNNWCCMEKIPAPASKTKLFITYGWVVKSSLPRDSLNYTQYILSSLSPVWNYMQAAGGFAALRTVRIYSAVFCKDLLCRNGRFVFIFSFWDRHIKI